LLASQAEPLTHGELARALRMPKSSLTEMLSTLEARHYVARTLEGGAERFRLGPQVLYLAGALLRRTDVVRLAQPAIAALMLRTGESAALVLRQGAEVVVVCKENCDQPILYSLQLGERGPLNTSAGGKAILAYASDADREAYLAQGPLVAVTPRSIVDPTALRRELAEIVRGGVAASREEMVEGIVALGYPVLDAQGLPCAGLSVGIPTLRCTPAKERLVAEALRCAGADISTALGWRGKDRRAAE
jgi:DNA-binding IclR family transcriptional regulator